MTGLYTYETCKIPPSTKNVPLLDPGDMPTAAPEGICTTKFSTAVDVMYLLIQPAGDITLTEPVYFTLECRSVGVWGPALENNETKVPIIHISLYIMRSNCERLNSNQRLTNFRFNTTYHK